MTDSEFVDRTIIRVMQKALDDLVTACDGKGVDKKELMKAKAMLPEWCKNTLIKDKK